MATLPVRAGIFTNPLGISRKYPNDLRTLVWRNTILLGTTSLTPLQVKESIQTDLPSRGRPYPGTLRTWTQNVNIGLIGKDALLPQRNRYDMSLPIARQFPSSLRVWTQNLQETTLAPAAAAPVGDNTLVSSLGSRPAYPNYLRTWTQNLQETTLAPRVLILSVDIGTYSITGQDAGLLYGHVLPGDIGSYSVTGSAAQFFIVEPGDVGSYSITGFAADLSSSLLPAPATREASFANQLGSRRAYPNDLRTWTQNLQETTLAPRALILSGDIGTYSVTGSAAALLEGHVSAEAVGSYSITGPDAGLILSTVPTLATRSASFANQLGSRGVYQNSLRTWTQNLQQTSLVPQAPVRAGTGSFVNQLGSKRAHSNDLRSWTYRNITIIGATVITPQQIRERIQTDLPGRLKAYPNVLRFWAQNLRETTLASQNKILTSDIGTYSVTGFDAQFAEVVPATVGAYSITGSAAGLIEGHVLFGAVGSYSITGSAAQFVQAVHVLTGAVGSYNIIGSAANLISSHVIPPVVVQAGGGGFWGVVGGTSRQPRDRRRLKFAAQSGAYSLSGCPAEFVVVRHYRLRIEKVKRKNYQIVSGRPSLRKDYVMLPDPFIMAISGAAANGKCNSFETIMRAMDRKRMIDYNNIFLIAA